MTDSLLFTSGMLAGGVGLFLLAVSMITDGLQLAAGKQLKNLLASCTASPLRGTLTGITITALVQSSSAVTVATIGFVNAGLLSLYQALGVVFGTNVGTTVTGWLVAAIGFEIKVSTFALPLVGIGMILRISGGHRRVAHIGTAIAGFGLFFIGIGVLKEAFEGVVASVELQMFTLQGIAEVPVYLAIGFLMTVLTQSSSAAIAITLTAATGGLVGLYAAAAMVIGANMGTTTTAALSVIGATPSAKRVAAAHVVFNLFTAIVALLILPLLFWFVRLSSEKLGLADIPAVTLALFHTVFNVLGLMLMWPLGRHLTRWLSGRFVTQEEIESRPKYLDKNIAASPHLALDALLLELTRMLGIVRRMGSSVLNREVGWEEHVRQDYTIVERLSNEIFNFISQLGKASLADEVSVQLSRFLRAQQHFIAGAEQALEISKSPFTLTELQHPDSQQAVRHFRGQAARLIEMMDLQSAVFSVNECENQLKQMQLTYDEAKNVLLQSGGHLRSPASETIATLDENSHVRRMARQMIKGIRDLDQIETAGRPDRSERRDTNTLDG